MADCKPVTTPLEQGKKYEQQPDGSEAVQAEEYQAIIGCLTYAAVATRPDLSAAVGVLSQFMSNPGPEHWIGVKRILRYVKGTIDYGLKFNALNANNIELQGYLDTDWEGDITSRKSTSGCSFQLIGGIISWRSKRQNIVALSSTEAEYIALTLASQEAIWLRRLLSSIGFKQSTATALHEDNQRALELSRNPIHHARTKHIDIRYHFIREAVESKEVELMYCPTNLMIADIFTKGLAKQRFNELREQLGFESLRGFIMNTRQVGVLIIATVTMTHVHFDIELQA